MPICKVCGKEFRRSESPSRFTCGDPECARQRVKQKARQRRGSTFVPEEVPCPYCGQLFVTRNSTSVTCGKRECVLAHKRVKERTRPKPKKALPKKVCEYCGETFTPEQSNRVTCGKRECKLARKRAIAKQQQKSDFVQTEKVCEYCGETFVQKHPNNRICGKHECKLAHKRAMSRLRYSPAALDRRKKAKDVMPEAVESRQCPQCGKIFTAYRSAKQACCSKRCSEARREDVQKAAFLASVEDPWPTLTTLPPGCVSWYSAQMMPCL